MADPVRETADELEQLIDAVFEADRPQSTRCGRCGETERIIIRDEWTPGVLDRWKQDLTCHNCGWRWMRDHPDHDRKAPPPKRRNYGWPLHDA